MKNYNRISKRLLACLLTLAMIVSAFSGAFGIISSALTEGTDFTIANNTTVSGDSVVDGDAAMSFYNGSTTTTISSQNVGKLTDGIMSSSSQLEIYYTQTPFYTIKEGHSATEKSYSAVDTWYIGGERYLDFTLTLKANSSISNIVLMNHSDAALMTGKFAVYASEDKATLFNAGNLIKDVDNTTAKKQTWNFTFSEGKELTGKKFVGLRMYSPVTDASEAGVGSFMTQHGANIIYPRLFEFNVFGTAEKTDFSVTSDNTFELPTSVDTSAVASLEATFFKNGIATYSATNDTKSEIAGLIDGSISTEPNFMDGGPHNYVYIDTTNGQEHITDGTYHLDLTYTIKENFLLKDIVVVNHQTADLKTGKYQIFMSNDKATLFSAPATTYVFDNTGNETRQHFKLGDGAGLTYKYVGVRIISPVQDIATFARPDDYCVPRIFELNVYGSTTSSSSDIATTVTKDDNTTLPAGDNLVEGMVPEAIYYKDNVKTAEGFGEITANASDADPATLVHTGGRAPHANGSKVLTEADGVYTDLIYDLGAKSTISSFLIFNHSNPQVRMNEFKLYMADSRANLFKSDAFVGTFTTEGKLRNVIALDTPLKARYVALRATDVLYDKTFSTQANDVYLRLADFCVFGEKAVVKNKITLASSNNDAACVINKNVAVSSMKQYYINPTTGTRETTGTYTTAVDENNQT